MTAGVVTEQDARPFLRWMGSKRRDAPAVVQLLKGTPGPYVEPFVGSGAVFFAGDFGDGSRLSDANTALIAAYATIRDEPGNVTAELQRLAALPVDSTYESVRNATADASLSSVEAAAAFVYLNSHCYNGIYRTNKAGRFNVPRGDRAGQIPTTTQITHAARQLSGVILEVRDGVDQIRNASSGSRVYADPPYVSSRPTYGEYGYHNYNSDRDDQLAAAIQGAGRRGVNFVVTIGQVSPTWRDVTEEFTLYERARTPLVAGNRVNARPLQEYLVTNINGGCSALGIAGWRRSVAA